MGRPPKGATAMSGAERIRRWRERHGKPSNETRNETSGNETRNETIEALEARVREQAADIAKRDAEIERLRKAKPADPKQQARDHWADMRERTAQRALEQRAKAAAAVAAGFDPEHDKPKTEDEQAARREWQERKLFERERAAMLAKAGDFAALSQAELLQVAVHQREEIARLKKAKADIGDNPEDVTTLDDAKQVIINLRAKLTRTQTELRNKRAALNKMAEGPRRALYVFGRQGQDHEMLAPP